MTIEWNFFDRQSESLVTKRHLPHIDMPGHLTFVTFRLADSMPRQVVERWHDEIERWMIEHHMVWRARSKVFYAEMISMKHSRTNYDDSRIENEPVILTIVTAIAFSVANSHERWLKKACRSLRANDTTTSDS